LLISTPIKSESFNIQSPEEEDNCLYDIALTAHAKLLVTGEKALLTWTESPVETINLAAFKKFF
jgi:predicted nucleic acid-binding protein